MRQEVIEAARRAHKETGVPASILLALFIKEHRLDSGDPEGFNFFGIKYHPGRHRGYFVSAAKPAGS